MNIESPAIQDQQILVVDDDDDIRSSLQEILAAEGYETLTAKNGAEALKLIREHHPSLVLLDIMMPVMDGYEFLEQQRTDSSIAEVPVIVLSAGASLDALSKGIPRIRKPPDLDMLFKAISTHIRPTSH